MLLIPFSKRSHRTWKRAICMMLRLGYISPPCQLHCATCCSECFQSHWSSWCVSVCVGVMWMFNALNMPFVFMFTSTCICLYGKLMWVKACGSLYPSLIAVLICFIGITHTILFWICVLFFFFEVHLKKMGSSCI